MPWIGAIAAVAGGMMASDAAGSAADQQAESAKQANETQRYMFDKTTELNKPFYDNGVASSNKLAQLLGLGAGGSNGGAALTRDQLRTELLPKYTTSATSPDMYQAFKDRDAYQTWTNTPQGERMLWNPAWDKYGVNAIGTGQWTMPGTTPSSVDENSLNAAIEARLQQQSQQQAAQSDPTYGSLLRNFSQDDLNNDVVYQNGLQFGLDEGEKGLNRQAAASGSLLSGATLKALSRYGNDYATTKTNDAYNRFNNNKQQTYNMLAGQTGTGQVASSQVASAGQNYANNVSSNQIGVGNARAASAIGGANALAGGLTGGYNNYQNGQFMNALGNRMNGGYTLSSNGDYIGGLNDFGRGFAANYNNANYG